MFKMYSSSLGEWCCAVHKWKYISGGMKIGDTLEWTTNNLLRPCWTCIIWDKKIHFIFYFLPVFIKCLPTSSNVIRFLQLWEEKWILELDIGWGCVFIALEKISSLVFHPYITLVNLRTAKYFPIEHLVLLI